LPLVRINWHNQEMPQPHLGDLSYGLYLWHFPIIRWAISRGWLKQAPRLAAGAAFLMGGRLRGGFLRIPGASAIGALG